MTRTQHNLAIAAALIVSLALCVVVILSFLVRQSNCGGNSTALAACQSYVIFLKTWAADNDGRVFNYEHADQEAKEQLGRIAANSRPWIREARFLAKVDDVSIEPASNKRVILVCDHSYDNVPQWRFIRSPLAHAVAYSTGDIGLISTADFARLDISDFVDLQHLRLESNVGPEDGANGNQIK